MTDAYQMNKEEIKSLLERLDHAHSEVEVESARSVWEGYHTGKKVRTQLNGREITIDQITRCDNRAFGPHTYVITVNSENFVAITEVCKGDPFLHESSHQSYNLIHKLFENMIQDAANKTKTKFKKFLEM